MAKQRLSNKLLYILGVITNRSVTRAEYNCVNYQICRESIERGGKFLFLELIPANAE